MQKHEGTTAMTADIKDMITRTVPTKQVLGWLDAKTGEAIGVASRQEVATHLADMDMKPEEAARALNWKPETVAEIRRNIDTYRDYLAAAPVGPVTLDWLFDLLKKVLVDIDVSIVKRLDAAAWMVEGIGQVPLVVAPWDNGWSIAMWFDGRTDVGAAIVPYLPDHWPPIPRKQEDIDLADLGDQAHIGALVIDTAAKIDDLLSRPHFLSWYRKRGLPAAQGPIDFEWLHPFLECLGRFYTTDERSGPLLDVNRGVVKIEFYPNNEQTFRLEASPLRNGNSFSITVLIRRPPVVGDSLPSADEPSQTRWSLKDVWHPVGMFCMRHNVEPIHDEAANRIYKILRSEGRARAWHWIPGTWKISGGCYLWYPSLHPSKLTIYPSQTQLRPSGLAGIHNHGWPTK